MGFDGLRPFPKGLMDLDEYGHLTIDDLEGAMLAGIQVEMPVIHRQTPGLYSREIHIPAGTLLTSAVHKTEHQFVISQGRIAVISENEGRVIYEAPYTGVTLPGTRRVLHAETDTIWITFHATEETDIAKICESLVEPPDNALLAERVPGYLTNLPPCIES
jgi:hypothetical protein